MEKVILGIDISKVKIDVALLKANKFYNNVFANSEVGFNELKEWLRKNEIETLHVAMEATGTYWENVAECLHKQGHIVSVINPLAISAYSASKLNRNKTDKQDAKTIASYCLSHNPVAWQPTEPKVALLQALVRRLESLQILQQEEKNRLESAPKQANVVKSLEESINFFQTQIDLMKKLIAEHIVNSPKLKSQKYLLVSIPGIADTTAANLMAEIVNINNYENARQAAAYAGLTPQHRLSGSSVKGKTRLSKIGSSRLRKILYFPAISAKQHNPLVNAFAQRLSLNGKHTMVIISACMRKLLHIIFGVLKSGKPFDPNFSPPFSHNSSLPA